MATPSARAAAHVRVRACVCGGSLRVCVRACWRQFTDFEGGTRVAAWASGGVIPAAMRGSTLTQLMHICDWHGTFSFLAGAQRFTPESYY